MLGKITVTSKPISDNGVEPRRREEVMWLTLNDQSKGRLVHPLLTAPTPRFSLSMLFFARQYCAIGQMRCIIRHMVSRMALLHRIFLNSLQVKKWSLSESTRCPQKQIGA